MSFSFNFSSSSDDEDDQQTCVNDDFEIKNNVVIDFSHDDDDIIKQTLTSSKLIAKESELIKDIGEFDPVKNDLFRTSQQISQVTQYTDVIHGVYEGGLKLWECSDDLLQYLSQDLPADRFIGKRVIDLGCGHGHPGIWCLTRGSALVCFQDLNTDALSAATVPNVLRICGSNCIIKKHRTNIQSDTTASDNNNNNNNDSSDEIAQLQALVTDNKIKGKVNELCSSTDTLQYERIKALVLSGEETDPEMIQWVFEVEQELCLGDDNEDENQDRENSCQDEDEDEDEDEDDEIIVDDGEDEALKELKLKQTTKASVITNNGYKTDYYTTLPHATFLYGPWGQYQLEQCMLLNNHYQVLDLSNNNSTYDETNQIDIKNKQLIEIIINKVVDCYNNYNNVVNDESRPHPSTSFQTIIKYNISRQTFECLFDNDEHDINTLFSGLLITQPSDDDVITTTTTKDDNDDDDHCHVIYTRLSITPSIVVIDDIILPVHVLNINDKDIDNKYTTITNAIEQILTFITSITATINNIYTQAIKSHSSSLSQKQTKFQYLYTTPTSQFRDSSDKSNIYQFSTVLSMTLKTSEQLKWFKTFVQNQFYETSWLVNQSEEEQGKEDETGQIEGKIGITMAKVFISDNITNNSDHKQYMTPDLAQIGSSLSYIYQKTPPPTAKSKNLKPSTLWYGSHPLRSPYRYDIILSSDTIYSSPTMPVLLQTLRSLLAYDGKAYIAAKRYYFGVGGGTAEFCQHITMHCPDMVIRSSKQFIDGGSNIREILLLEWNQDVLQNVW